MQNHKAVHNCKAWLGIVQEDLMAAEGLLALELFSTVTFHCQQAAEKSLKAYLVFKEQPILKTHDLLRLLELCMCIDKDFEKIFDAADYLNPFLTKFRYPTEYDIPDFADAKLAITYAQKAVSFVGEKILEPWTGSISFQKAD